jgi:hypothetical protein
MLSVAHKTIMLSVVMLSVIMLYVIYAECHLCRLSFMLSVTLKTTMLSVVMLSVIMRNVFALNVVDHFQNRNKFSFLLIEALHFQLRSQVVIKMFVKRQMETQ